MAHKHSPQKVAGDTLATMIVGSIVFFGLVPFLLYRLADIINGCGDLAHAILGG